jgi:Tfp pilus assembly protein FimT
MKGFSMIEVLVVLGFFAIVGTVGLLVSMESYRGSNFRTDRDLLVALLQHARTDALGSVCRGSTCDDAVAHGVFINDADNQYVVFEGNSYSPGDPQNRVFEASPVTVRSGLSEAVFEPYTGNPTTSGTITLEGEGRTSTTTIGAQGQISWTN